MLNPSNSKERFLDEHEIVENLVHNSTGTVCWTIRRPLRGWYIRIQSPTFPPHMFIPLVPIPCTSPFHTDAALSLKTRTNVSSIPLVPPAMDSQITLQDNASASSSTTSVHSYPPTPTAGANAQPLSPTHAKSPGYFDQSTIRRRSKPIPSPFPTEFLLTPSSTQPAQELQNASFFTRALSVLRSHRPSHSNSFTLSRIVPPDKAPPPPYAADNRVTADAAQCTDVIQEQQQPQPYLHTPLLVFHDQTPVLTVRSLTGLIEMDKAEESYLGVDTSFWIAVALTYLEFLEEREGFLAALSD
ncbi:hypothetical protein M413DRAFT_10822 [Hebeloma cylindrosporum]|uniref:Uncharacterized protein n=1 Tax=Hebeloma cylindrosporum TaxID=76867 RepID=A0A0C3CEE5_HEBCY|nr:hypothetical protein M413DRAFT_10822 [Hebeloma cylindrosporum h7]